MRTAAKCSFVVLLWGLVLGLSSIPPCSAAVSPSALGLSPQVIANVLAESPCDPMSAALNNAEAEQTAAAGWDLIRHGQPDQALAIWAEVVRRDPRTVQAQKALFNIAVQLMESTGSFDRACELYRLAVSMHPGDQGLRFRERLWEIELYFYAENLAHRDGAAALQALADEYAGKPEKGIALLRLSHYYTERGDKKSADAWYGKAISATPSAPYVPYAALARGYERLEAAPAHPEVPLLEREETDDALREFDRVLAWSEQYGEIPIAAEAMFMIGRVYHDARQLEEAEGWFLLAAERDPKGEWGANAEREASRCALRRGVAGDALVLCERVLARLSEAPWMRPEQSTVWDRDLKSIRESAQTKLGTTPPQSVAFTWTALSEAEAAAVKGSCPGSGWVCQQQGGCGSGCITLTNDPTYHHKMAVNLTYYTCVSGYWWQNCYNTRTWNCAQWRYYWADGYECDGPYDVKGYLTSSGCSP